MGRRMHPTTAMPQQLRPEPPKFAVSGSGWTRSRAGSAGRDGCCDTVAKFSQSNRFIGHGSGFSTDRPSHRSAAAFPVCFRHLSQRDETCVHRRPGRTASGPEHTLPMSGRHTHRVMTAMTEARSQGSQEIAMAMHEKPVRPERKAEMRCTCTSDRGTLNG